MNELAQRNAARMVGFVALALTLCTCTGLKSRLFGADMSKLQIGMTHQQVTDAIGWPSNIINSGPTEEWVYEAHKSDFSGGTVHVYFSADPSGVSRVTDWKQDD